MGNKNTVAKHKYTPGHEEKPKEKNAKPRGTTGYIRGKTKNTFSSASD